MTVSGLETEAQLSSFGTGHTAGGRAVLPIH